MTGAAHGRAVVLATLLAGPVQAEGLGLTADQRTAFGALLREVLLAEPEIVMQALAPPAPEDPYAADKAADLALIAAHGAALFGRWPATRHIAFFAAPDCADCTRAATELAVLATQTGWTVQAHDADGELARALGVPDAPFYVLPDLMIRGWMPAPALLRYLKPGESR